VPQLLKSENYIYNISPEQVFFPSREYGKDFFMVNIMNELKINILKNKGLIVVLLLVLSLLIPSIFTPSYTAAVKKGGVLGIASKSAPQITVPIVTVTPTPTSIIPSLTPVPTSIVLSPTPTPTITVTPTPTSAPEASPTPTSAPANTPTPTLTVTPIPTDTPSPTPAGLKIQVGINYAGQKTADSYSVSVNPGQSAWDAVVSAVGLSNLQYTDYGGSMGIFITGFNGINAASNQYFEFRVNGVSSNVGVSSYQCNDGDKLDFVLTSF
jgi:hypothetical protein